MIELARQFGRYGYRRIAALLREAGWSVSDGRVERLWRREGLKVPAKQPKKGRLWLNDGSCVRLRPEYRNHVWSYDFVHCRTDDGKVFRTLNIIDEHSRECLAIKVKRKLNSTDVIDVLTDLFILRGAPAFIRSDNGPEFVAQAVRDWIAAPPRRPPRPNAGPGINCPFLHALSGISNCVREVRVGGRRSLNGGRALLDDPLLAVVGLSQFFKTPQQILISA